MSLLVSVHHTLASCAVGVLERLDELDLHTARVLRRWKRLDVLRSWFARHPAWFALTIWALPVVLLLPPALLLVERPEIALPMLFAGPVLPAAMSYHAARSGGLGRSQRLDG